MKNKYLASLCFAASLVFLPGCSDYTYEDGENAFYEQDFQKAKDIWKEVAEKQQNDKAMYALANLYKENPAFMSYEESLSWLMQAADAGRPDAQYEFGKFLDSQNRFAEAYKYIEQAAIWNEERAKAYMDKYGPIKQVRLEAELGEPKAMYEYAKWLLAQRSDKLSAEDNDKILDEARSWALKSARAGDHQGQGVFGKILYLKRAYATAAIWLEKAANAEDPTGLYYLALLYLEGNGVIRNEVKGANMLIKAAELNEPHSQLKLALMYFADKLPPGVAVDPKKASEWIQSSADKGVVEAQYLLAKSYEDGLGVKQNFKEAMRLYKLAADAGFTKANDKLARLYVYFGDASQKKEGLAILEKLVAEQNSNYARLILADIYLNGIAVNTDYQKGIDYYKQAAESNDSIAQYELGVILMKGVITEKNQRSAGYWLARAATNDDPNPNAQMALCVLYDRGLAGFSKDTLKSSMWCEKAAERGVTDKRYALTQLGFAG